MTENQFTLETYADLEEHLLATMDSANDDRSKTNQSFTYEQSWNLFMKCCIEAKDKTTKVHDMIIKNVLRDFPFYKRCDADYETANESTIIYTEGDDGIKLPF